MCEAFSYMLCRTITTNRAFLSPGYFPCSKIYAKTHGFVVCQTNRLPQHVLLWCWDRAGHVKSLWTRRYLPVFAQKVDTGCPALRHSSHCHRLTWHSEGQPRPMAPLAPFSAPPAVGHGQRVPPRPRAPASSAVQPRILAGVVEGQR